MREAGRTGEPGGREGMVGFGSEKEGRLAEGRAVARTELVAVDGEPR